MVGLTREQLSSFLKTHDAVREFEKLFTDVDGMGTLSTQDADAVNITGGSINGTVIGSSIPAASRFTLVILKGSGSGELTVKSPPISGANTLTLPAGTTDFSLTGGASQVVKQTTLGGAFTVAQLGANDLSNGVVGTGAIVLDDSPTITNPVLVDAVVSSILFNSTAGIIGTATNDDADAGSVGEYVSSSVGLGNAAASTDWEDVTSIPLTPGDYEVYGQIVTSLNGATLTASAMGISSTSGNFSTGLTLADNLMPVSIATTDNNGGGTIAGYRVSVGSNTTYYLKSNMTYSAGTPQRAGRMSARRIR